MERRAAPRAGARTQGAGAVSGEAHATSGASTSEAACQERRFFLRDSLKRFSEEILLGDQTLHEDLSKPALFQA